MAQYLAGMGGIRPPECMDQNHLSYPPRQTTSENNYSWLGRRDSNPRMPGPKPGALPLGHVPIKKNYLLGLILLRNSLHLPVLKNFSLCIASDLVIYVSVYNFPWLSTLSISTFTRIMCLQTFIHINSLTNVSNSSCDTSKHVYCKYNKSDGIVSVLG